MLLQNIVNSISIYVCIYINQSSTREIVRNFQAIPFNERVSFLHNSHLFMKIIKEGIFGEKDTIL